MKQALIIFCSHPGLIRAGRVHPMAKAHDPASFTLDQYREMLHEPSLVLARGELLTLASLEAELGPMPSAAGRIRPHADTGFRLGALPADVGLNGPTSPSRGPSQELGLPSDLDRRHVADEVVLRDADGRAILRSDGTEAIPAGGNAPAAPMREAVLHGDGTDVIYERGEPVSGAHVSDGAPLTGEALTADAPDALTGEALNANATNTLAGDALADELAVRNIEGSARDIITGQPTPAPLADDIVAEPGDTEVQRRVEDVTARAAGRHRARRT